LGDPTSNAMSIPAVPATGTSTTASHGEAHSQAPAIVRIGGDEANAVRSDSATISAEALRWQLEALEQEIEALSANAALDPAVRAAQIAQLQAQSALVQASLTLALLGNDP